MKTFDELNIGDIATYTKTFSEEDVFAFARLTGDYNLIHIDNQFAEKSIFKKKIVHGFLTAGMISKVIGTELPGLGTIYMSQDLRFLKPVYINDTITATVIVTEKDESRKSVKLETVCKNQNDEIVIAGSALVKAPVKMYVQEDNMDNYLRSNNLVLKLVEESDAEFILELRKNPELNKYIHSTDISVEEQQAWIRKYKEKEKDGKEFYFRIDTKEGEPLGFVRVYNIDYDKGNFTWGSWIMKPDHPKYAAIESAIIIYEFAFDYLKMNRAIYDVRLENKGVLHFHDRFGSTRTTSDDLDQYYCLTKEDYYRLRDEKYFEFIQDKNNKVLAINDNTNFSKGTIK